MPAITIKTILLFWLCSLCFLFSSFVEAELSDQEKREFIESLATPLKKKRIFYRWQSEQSKKNLLKAGEMTPQLYDYFMGLPDPIAGSGLYVAGDMASSSSYGATLLQVEVEAGYKILDFSDPEVKIKLSRQGITHKDINELNPKVAVKYTEDAEWFVLKAKDGIKFKPFSSEGVSLRALEDLYKTIKNSGPFLKSAIRKDILNRAEKSSEVFGSLFIHIIEKEKGTQYVQNAVNRHKASPNTLDEVNGWLKHARGYLDQNDVEALVNKVKSLPIESIDQSIDLLRNLPLTTHFKSYRKQVIDKTIPLIKNVEDRTRFLGMLEYYLQTSDIKRLTHKMIPLIQSTEDGLDLYNHAKEHLTPLEREQIVNKTIPLVQSAEEGVFIITNMEDDLKLSEKKDIVKKIVPLIRDTEGGISILNRIENYLDPSDRRQIIDKTIPLIRNTKDGILTLKYLPNYLTLSDREHIVKRTTSLVQNVDEGIDVLNSMGGYLDPLDKRKVVGKIIPLIKNSRDGIYTLKRINKHLTSSDIKRITKKIIPFIQSANEGFYTLRNIRKHLSPSDKKRIEDKIVRLIGTAKEGMEILKNADEFSHDPSNRKRIIRKIIPLIRNMEEGKEILYIVDLLPKDRKQIVTQILKLNGKKGLEEVRELLTQDEYNEALTKLKDDIRNKAKPKIFQPEKLTQRLDCLKKQLQQVLVK